VLPGHWYRLSKSAKGYSVRLRGNEKIIKDWTQSHSYYTVIIVIISKIREKKTMSTLNKSSMEILNNLGLCPEKEEALFQKNCPHCYSEKVKIRVAA
jgi:hypothetical protein